MTKKYVFVDLDETLVHCSFLGSKEKSAKFKKKGSEVINLSLGDEPPEYYQCFLRGNAPEMLEKIRALPDTEVYMLTAATKDYALANNEKFNLRFTGDRVFSREDTNLLGRRFAERFPKDTDFDLFLIDNLPYGENDTKIQWLNDLGKSIGGKGIARSHYIQISDYYGGKFGAIDDQFINDVIEQIRNT